MYKLLIGKKQGSFDNIENALRATYDLGNTMQVDTTYMQIHGSDQSIQVRKIGLYENARMPKNPFIAIIQEEVEGKIKFVLYECTSIGELTP
jgi:hypothetical protein